LTGGRAPGKNGAVAEDALTQLFGTQARVCGAFGSIFYAGLLERAAANADGPHRRLLSEWSGSSLAALLEAAVALRFLGALHELALSGHDLALTAAFPPVSSDPERGWRAAQDAIAAHESRLRAFMAHEPQTNEVRRSIVLLGGFLEVAAATGLPLRVFEIGASAGLNLSWDRYRYELGGAAWGDPNASVRMDTDWRGPLPPLDAPVRVIERAACDRRPTDLGDPDQRRRLLSYYWPDQTERIARIHAAIDFAVATGVRVETATAAAWTRARVGPQPGAATVVFHSSFWPYLSPADQDELRQILEAIGAPATREAPFAWLSKEPPTDQLAADELVLRLWPGGEAQRLAETHPHGAWVEWRSQAAPPI
jgi:hypothetical protein